MRPDTPPQQGFLEPETPNARRVRECPIINEINKALDRCGDRPLEQKLHFLKGWLDAAQEEGVTDFDPAIKILSRLI